MADLDAFRRFSDKESTFVRKFKTGELTTEPGATILMEGTAGAHLYTVLDGWGFRYKMLEDGRRQILNYILPGDLVGLQGSLMDEMDHAVESMTAMRLCMFEKSRLGELFRNHPTLSYDMTWIAAREERILDEHLLSVGRRSALERAAYLLAFLHSRAAAVGMATNNAVSMPLTQQHVADTLGLSIVHTNKTLKKLVERGLLKWLEKGCIVTNPGGLAEIASWEYSQPSSRPYI